MCVTVCDSFNGVLGKLTTSCCRATVERLSSELFGLAALLRGHIEQLYAAAIQHLLQHPHLGVLVTVGGQHLHPHPQPLQGHHLVLQETRQPLDSLSTVARQQLVVSFPNTLLFIVLLINLKLLDK